MTPLPPISFQVVTLRCKRRWHEGRSKAIEADESVAGEVCALFAGWEKLWKNEQKDVKNEMLHIMMIIHDPFVMFCEACVITTVRF